jgi:Raf kinase inhibitor-like YbhB/YbcL family protein
MADFLLASSAFAAGGTIPRRHSCDGEDRSPPLSWTAPPTGSRSLADAPGGRFVHWLAWGIAPAAGGLAEGEAAPLEGSDDFGSIGYRGPCPPRGRHRYRFRLHALGEVLRLAPGARPDRVAAGGSGRRGTAPLADLLEAL